MISTRCLVRVFGEETASKAAKIKSKINLKYKEDEKMKSFTVKSMITMAAMTVAAGIASAQALKVEIPFSFRAGETMMAPGTYMLVANSYTFHTAAIKLRRYGEGGGILMLANARDAAKEWVRTGLPKVAFDCLEGRCTLATVWNGTSRDALEVRMSKREMQENANLSVITLSAIRVK